MRSQILLVDDEPHVTAALRDALRREPYDVLCSNSAAEALALLSRQPVDVIISDERMPGMQGSEFLAVARRRHPDTVRLLLTGHASLEAAIRAINEGEIYRFFTKPCNVQDLAATLRQALRQRRLLLLCRGLLDRVQSQETLLADLERSHPGITAVPRDPSGAIRVEDLTEDVAELLNGL